MKIPFHNKRKIFYDDFEVKLKEIFLRVRERIQKAKRDLEERNLLFKTSLSSITEIISEDWIERALQKARETLAPSIDEIPLNLELRKLGFFRKIFERTFPVTYAFRLRYRYGREFLDEFMPISYDTFLGRGSYKFVYALPWKMVIKVSKMILPSDPLCGSLFTEVRKKPERFLTSEELQLYEHFSKGLNRFQKEFLWFQFLRLGLERYHYAIVKENLPDLIIPTRFFIGMQYRRHFLNDSVFFAIKPMDVQVLLAGKHLKELIKSGKRVYPENLLLRWITPPKYKFEFDIGVFSNIKKRVLYKIKEDLQRLANFTQRLAREEKLILDIHTENIIITIPEFELKLFDFHIFDEHLYDYDDKLLKNPEKEHIDVIEQFIESFDLE
ncbi:MAG: hypothetical protein NZ853_07920 [Leptospiraceae bacterium]|nr:hypothetical protein [Leptospiraceae bacterium]MDW7976901.1 hypothetical protein [Leptospiraceae bacterium]